LLLLKADKSKMENPAALLKIAVEVNIEKKERVRLSHYFRLDFYVLPAVNWDQSELRNR